MIQLPYIKNRLMEMMLLFLFRKVISSSPQEYCETTKSKRIILCPAVAWRYPQSMKETLVKYKQALSKWVIEAEAVQMQYNTS